MLLYYLGGMHEIRILKRWPLYLIYLVRQQALDSLCMKIPLEPRYETRPGVCQKFWSQFMNLQRHSISTTAA